MKRESKAKPPDLPSRVLDPSRSHKFRLLCASVSVSSSGNQSSERKMAKLVRT